MKHPTHLPKYLTQEELKRFFAAIPKSQKRDRALFLIIYRYGLRVSEAAELREEDINFKDNRISLSRKKNGIPTQRRLYDDVKRALRAYLKERQETGNSLFTGRQGDLGVSMMQKLFKWYAREARLDKNFSIHSLRHSIAVHSLETERVDIRDVQDLLGHRAIQNTLVYAQITDKRRNQVDDLLERSREIVKL